MLYSALLCFTLLYSALLCFTLHYSALLCYRLILTVHARAREGCVLDKYMVHTLDASYAFETVTVLHLSLNRALTEP
jgi:hypothetical protein